MAPLDAEPEALAAEDLHDLTSAELLHRTAELIAERNRIDAELAGIVRAAELAQAPEHDGLKSMPSWLKGHGRLSGRAAKAVVRTGRVLERLPAVAAGCAKGLISSEQVAMLAPVVTPEALEQAAAQGVDVAEVDAVLTEVAATRPYDELRRVVHHYLTRLDPDGLEPDPTESRALVDRIRGLWSVGMCRAVAAAHACLGFVPARSSRMTSRSPFTVH
jgi:Domain of unknown function (DUF222)